MTQRLRKPTKLQFAALRIAYSSEYSLSIRTEPDESWAFDRRTIMSLINHGLLTELGPEGECDGEHCKITTQGCLALGVTPTPPQDLTLEDAVKLAIVELIPWQHIEPSIEIMTGDDQPVYPHDEDPHTGMPIYANHTGATVSVVDENGQFLANIPSDHTDDPAIAWSCVGRRLTELGFPVYAEMDLERKGIVSFWPQFASNFIES